MKKNILIGVIVVSILIFTFVKISFLDNVNFWCFVAEKSGSNTSSLYYLSIERIYRIAEKKDIVKELIKRIDENENQNLHGFYVRILGVIGGGDQTINCLMKTYIKHQHSKETKMSLVCSIIDALGLLGKEKVVPFLEAISNEDKDSTLNYMIVPALYLLTGKQYDFINRHGDEEKLYLSSKLIQAREIILATKGKKRKFKEMLVLDKLLRPPGR